MQSLFFIIITVLDTFFYPARLIQLKKNKYLQQEKQPKLNSNWKSKKTKENEKKKKKRTKEIDREGAPFSIINKHKS